MDITKETNNEYKLGYAIGCLKGVKFSLTNRIGVSHLVERINAAIKVLEEAEND